MTMYVYSTDGEARGFVFETTIFGMDGAPLGRIVGPRVHRFDGAYAGEWFHQMVVDRPTARPRSLPSIPVPERKSPAPATCRRRSVAEYGNYRDAFDRLLTSPAAGALFEAAE
ncbi:hypothetical protein [Sphingosinicella sp. BN140058]|uniref:hypothetical protein n=1 Tax=Sphingosinicella sp. BN140058 TaxID=1892855 RepID=UPI001012EA7D|nr:hypothetical protein [Sphingosinicella sp. BN140058]QAY75417.1 hypothetical protein ETR14_01895 [Sphingosinicella sp. BN140058]